MERGAYTYVYLIGALLFVPVWLLLYWRSPSSRREMLVMSGLALAIGLPKQALLYTKDWWHPVTVTGTLVGIEDVIYAIGNGGYMAALFAGLTGGVLVADRTGPSWARRIAPVACMTFVPTVLFYVLGVHSFVGTTVGNLAALTLVLAARPDLTRVAVLSGLLGTAVAIPVYVAMEAAFPGATSATWDTSLSGVRLVGIPVEDVLWYVYTTALWASFYKFAVGARVSGRVTSTAPRQAAVT